LRPAHVFAKPSADAELQIVALLQGPWRFALRLMMIWLSLRGLTASEIAALFEYDPRTVRRWIDRYNHRGIAGLEDRPRSGAPRLGSAGLGRRIRMLLRQPGAWTVKQLRRRLGYPAMSLATLARRVREQASWRRPRLVAKGDPEEAAVVAALHQEITTLPESAVILAEDEAHINLLPWLRSCWIVKGERQEVMTPGKNQKRSLFGAIELATGRWLYHIVEHANSATFIEFLEQILDAYPRAPVIAIVLDNVSTHTSRAVERWLAGHARVKLLYGARYSPHHNPVERVWGAMKRHLANSPTLTMLGRIQEVHAFFRARSRAQMLDTASPFNTPWLPPGYGQKLWKAA
jgi:DDE superfamily endonuclease/Winged helix-turn helix